MPEGKFTPKTTKHVVIWSPPDANGDGDPVMTDEGEVKEDSQGREVRHYLPPEGFVNVASKNEYGAPVADNYVETNRGQVVRDKNGNPRSIVEGGGSITHPDGSYELLPPKKVKEFLANHEQVDA